MTASACAIDVAGGVERLMGDHRLFIRVLQRFCSDYRLSPHEIRASLATGDVGRAQRLSHTLKGAAGMIDAHALHHGALALEQALRTRPGDCTSEIELLQAELERVLAEAGRLIAAGERPAEAEPASPAPVHAVARLREMLELGDGAAVHVLNGGRAELVGVLGADRYRELSAAVDRFDFGGALRLLGGAANAS
ncbi:MAG: Hpt domain-containing protein [Massilia sp.]